VLADDPLRTPPAVLTLTRSAIRDRLVSPKFGPVVQVMRDTTAPFAMSNAVLPGAPAMGYGRTLTFDSAEPLAVLEAYERLGGYPSPGIILPGVPYRDVAEAALDPAALGTITPEQLAHPLCRLLPSDAGTPLDWTWGHLLGTREPRLVPAEIAFFLHRPLPATAGRRRQYFEDCSSGCAVGGSHAEATLHALLELHERDAFLLAWHRAAPLSAIDLTAVTDPMSRRLLDLIDSHGYDAHLLVTTADIDLPAIWSLAVRRDGGYPAAFSAAAGGVDPERVIRGALWELAQQVVFPIAKSREQAESMAADPWLIEDIDDHIGVGALPEMLSRVTAALGGPVLTPAEAFPGWPGDFLRAAGGDIRGTLEQVAERFRRAGLNQVIVVDQSTRDHADLGLHAVKTVVPGIIAMNFGHPQQRLAGLERLARVLPPGSGPVPYDPHPFP
jgi:ribosomal protein S12 methylthiotransferase accessory factor